MKFFVFIFAVTATFMSSAQENGEIRLIMRGDDMGALHSFNVACIKGYKEGIITTTEVIAPGPWFLEAAKLLQENPGLDVGVHLTLTSEWDNVKWGPITNSPSLVTENGYFPSSTDGFITLDPKLEEVEKKLRTQIELAKKHIPQLSHLSTHMGTARSTPEFTAIVNRLSEEYKLPVNPEELTNGFGMWAVPADEKEDFLADNLQNLEPGLHMCVVHPAIDDPETKATFASGNDANVRMSVYRQIVTNAVTSERIKKIVKAGNIKLVSYADSYAAREITSK